MKRRDPKRTLILRLRRTVKVSTRHSVEQVGPLTERLTCTVCGHQEDQSMPEGTSTVIAARLIRYRAQPGGVLGVCPGCSKNAAEERYPLPVLESKPRNRAPLQSRDGEVCEPDKHG